MKKNLIFLFLALVTNLSFGQNRSSYRSSEIVFNDGARKYRSISESTKKYEETEVSYKKKSVSPPSSLKHFVYPKTEAEQNKITMIPIERIRTPKEINVFNVDEPELIPAVVDAITYEQSSINERTWVIRVIDLTTEIGELRYAMRESKGSPKMDSRVWEIADSLLSVDNGRIPSLVIQEMEAYARDYEEKDMELLNIPQRKIQDVVVAYRYQETLDESKRWVGRWWNARPYKDVDLNPRLMARLRLTMEEDGTYGCFPLKTPRRPVVYSPFAVRNSQGAKYCEETGTFERGGHADMDGYKPDKHEGIDIPFGDDKTPPIHAWRSGVVVYSGYNASKKWRNGRLVSSGYGNIIIIRHTEADTTDEGKILPLVSAYAHLSRRDVEVGDVVEICDVIGLGGSSGGVPPHLHFEIRYGDMPLDPEAFLNLREKDDNSFRNYHIGTPLFGMSGGDYVIFALGDCPKNKFACDWTYTTAPSFACKDVGKDKSPKTNGIVLTKYTKP